MLFLPYIPNGLGSHVKFYLQKISGLIFDKTVWVLLMSIIIDRFTNIWPTIWNWFWLILFQATDRLVFILVDICTITLMVNLCSNKYPLSISTFSLFMVAVNVRKFPLEVVDPISKLLPLWPRSRFWDSVLMTYPKYILLIGKLLQFKIDQDWYESGLHLHIKEYLCQ